MGPNGKRKRGLEGTVEKGLAEKRAKVIKNVESLRERTDQYLHGVSIRSLPGLGCGTCTLGTPPVTSHYPIKGQMRFEVMSGTEGAGSGSVRLAGPPFGLDFDTESDIFMVPFCHLGMGCTISPDLVAHG